MSVHLVGSHNSDLTTSLSQLLPESYIYRVDEIQLIKPIVQPTSPLPCAWHMWLHCKQLCMKRKRERKWRLLPFQWKIWDNLQPRHCHLQEVKGALGLLMPECFHLAVAAVSQMSLWADPGRESKQGLWWWGGAVEKQILLSFGKYCLSLLREFTSSVTTVKLMVINNRQWRWASPFFALNKRSLWTPCWTLSSGVWARWWVSVWDDSKIRWF